jgi:probable F420-dependent oxidoreductase
MPTRRKQWKWGVLFSGDKLAMEDLLHYTALAEEAGADSVWAAELWRDGFVPLTAMASVTKKARVGTAVAHFARPPMLTELSAMSLAEYTHGRFILGLGTAPPEWNENWHGLSYRKPVTRMREYVECIRAMWTSTPTRAVNYLGECYQVKDYRRLMPAAYKEVPIYLAGVLPKMIQLAGSHANGLIANTLNTPRYFTEIIYPNLKQGWAAANRSRQDFEFCAVKACIVNANTKRARAIGRHAIAFYANLPYFDIVLDPMGFTEAKLAIRAAANRNDIPGMVQAVTEDMIDALVLAGTPDEVHRQLEPFTGLFDTLLLAFPAFAADAEETKASHTALIEAFAR